jgi:ribosome-binding protein aMBF1 (putative translation factor)
LGHSGKRPENGGGTDEGLADKMRAMKKTNFDAYLDEQLKNADFAERFKKAGVAWDLALQLAALRQQAGLSQKDLARKLRTSQQQVSRLESPSYEGHSLSMLRRVAEVLGATVQVSFVPGEPARRGRVAEAKRIYLTRKKS